MEPASISGVLPDNVDVVLSARIGAYEELATSIGRIGKRSVPRAYFVDGPDESNVTRRFFRAPAGLVVPDISVARVVVAALVIRPGGSSTHLRVEGAYSWADEQDEALAAVERLVQAYADQWFPARQLWSDPAETLLPSEISCSTRSSEP